MKLSVDIVGDIVGRKRSASARVTGLGLATALVWMIAAAGGAAAGQVSAPDANGGASLTADWTQFHRDNMQRWNPYETVLGVNNVGGLKLKWSSREDDPANGETFSSPAVGGGVLYVGDFNFNLYAINASTGEELWRRPLAGNGDCSPAIANGVIYSGSIDNYLETLEASTGKLLWSFEAGDPLYASPTVVNGVVYIATAGGNVYALNANNGSLLWRYAINAEIYSTPAVANQIIYVGAADHNLYALNATTGAKLWSYAAGGDVESSPAVANGVVYAASDDGRIYAWNASNGRLLWSFTTGGFGFESPAVANGVVYIGSLYNWTLYALNAATGSLVWSYKTDFYVESSPAVANGVVYIGSDDGNLYALNGASGELLWSYQTGASVYSSPAVVDGVLYDRNPTAVFAFALGDTADLLLRIQPTPAAAKQGDLITYAFPVWNLGPADADHEVLTTQVPEGTTFGYIRISGTPGLGTCTTPPYQGTGHIVCHENSSMAPNTTWTVRLTVKVTAPAGTVITENAATMADTPDPNMANNMATVSATVQ